MNEDILKKRAIEVPGISPWWNALVAVVVVAFSALAPVAVAAEETANKPVIVCSTTQVADFARQIVGDQGIVYCILAPGADPHTYMPTSRGCRTGAPG